MICIETNREIHDVVDKYVLNLEDNNGKSFMFVGFSDLLIRDNLAAV